MSEDDKKGLWDFGKAGVPVLAVVAVLWMLGNWGLGFFREQAAVSVKQAEQIEVLKQDKRDEALRTDIERSMDAKLLDMATGISSQIAELSSDVQTFTEALKATKVQVLDRWTYEETRAKYAADKVAYEREFPGKAFYGVDPRDIKERVRTSTP